MQIVAPSIPNKFFSSQLDIAKIDPNRMIVIVNEKCNLTKLKDTSACLGPGSYNILPSSQNKALKWQLNRGT